MYEKDVIKKLRFLPKEKTTDVYYKTYTNGYTLEINFENETINYGKDIKSDSKTTQNFSQPENFVVLECVDRLLTKGYKPKDITLEKVFPSGHGHSGRLDIFIRNGKKAFLMIECKTFGREFDKEFASIQKNGGQLFTYFQNDTNTDYLMLYTSRFANGKLEYKSEIIKIEESYRTAGNVEDVYNRWNKITYDNGIFDAHVEPYTFQNKLLTLKDLKPLTDKDADTLFHGFASILRKHSVSDKPNAFNKIFNLFLAKIYDEGQCDTDKKRNTVSLDFQWREGIDTDEDFQIRLINLHKEGVKRFLEKEIEGLSEEEIAAQRTADKQQYKRKWLKFNKIFDIKDVNDDESFDDNARVLKEVVALLAQYQIRYPRRQQHLSDFFEHLLTTGLKQEAGQYFTPVPITRFIAYSLPLKEMIIQEVNQPNPEPLLPAVMDYAAGSGHFLTEILERYQDIINELDTSDFYRTIQDGIDAWKKSPYLWAAKSIYGIEKDYRLVKVAKVGCYFYGDGLARVIHGDGLDNFEHSRTYRGLLKNNKDAPQFGVVVSNPPYSVEAFKGDLRNIDAKNDFSLFQYLTDRSSEIECLFVERTAQLLKEGGVAGIILPSSILSNTGIYTKTREILLQKFEIIAITELGSNTFMATGTNTVVLFLRKRNDKQVLQIIDGIETFFNSFKNITINGIEGAVTEYARYVWDVSFDDYVTLIKKEPNKIIVEHELYQGHRRSLALFDNPELPDDVRQIQLQRAWDVFFKQEKGKLSYFLLAYGQTVVLVKTGEKDAEKRFLGYEFSNRRGSEGIHPIQAGKTIDECTRLYDENVIDNPQKASTYIYRAFNGDVTSEIDASLLNDVRRVRLVDMLVFDRKTFEKTMSTAVKKKEQSKSKWGLVKLGSIAEILNGGTPDTKNQEYWDGDINWATLVDTKQKYLYDTERKITQKGVKNSNAILLPINTVIFSSRATIGDVCINKVPTCTNQGYKNFVCNSEKIHFEYLYHILKNQAKNIEELASGMTYPEISKAIISEYQIPLPPMDIQKKIVVEIEAVEKEDADIQGKIGGLNKQITNILGGIKAEIKKLGDLCTYSETRINCKLLTSKNYVGVDNILQNTAAKIDSNFVPSKGNATEYMKGDILLSNIRPYLKKIWYADTQGGSSNDVLVLQTKMEYNSKYIYYHLKSDAFFNYEMQAVKGIKMPRGDKQHILKYPIPCPPLPEQQKIVAKIEKLETEIQNLQNQQEQMKNQKEQILRKYL
ncbi:restriction endonuclease [Spirochaetia bacterium]|nr:restriction endonuclease [Spirochaetia bacterium]